MLNIDALFNGLLDRDRLALSKAITLVESDNPVHQKLANDLLARCEKLERSSLRIAVSGSPGVGKSTFIESLGSLLIERSYRPAVLSIDPSSTISKGSILGDKTRMERLSLHEAAYVRPTASRGSLGGISDRTQETLLLCEAAGYNVILVETVGVGQSEIEAHAISDMFLLLILPNSGDALQGIKKGIVEMSDLIIVNKADGENIKDARITMKQYSEALHLSAGNVSEWNPKCMMASSIDQEGIAEVWQEILAFQKIGKANNRFEKKREEQRMYAFLKAQKRDILSHMANHAGLQAEIKSLSSQLEQGLISVQEARNAFLIKLKALIHE